VLKDAPVDPAIPCQDLDRARAFYSEKLGLEPVSETPGGLWYEGGEATGFLLFPSSGRASGEHTQVGFRVEDIDAEVRDLKARGLVFDEYDFPGFDKQTHVAESPAGRSAWFKDSEGNLLGLFQSASS
jgi:catechol 2,3-dioxygenase-like lactoylglutathione lyase family enzyme